MEFKKDDENYIYEIISKNIKKYRRQKGWTQEKLAELINVSVSLISSLESNKSKKGISINNLYKISIVLNTPISKFMEDNDEL